MSNSNQNKFTLPEQPEKIPFFVPDDYFNQFSSRVHRRILMDEVPEEEPVVGIWSRIRPHLSLAAAIIGFALITFTSIRLLTGGSGNVDDYYDLTILNKEGIILDESLIFETYKAGLEEGVETYSEWEEDAMNFLASNEVDLDLLLTEN